jgi:hypothetical protein
LRGSPVTDIPTFLPFIVGVGITVSIVTFIAIVLVLAAVHIVTLIPTPRHTHPPLRALYYQQHRRRYLRCCHLHQCY